MFFAFPYEQSTPQTLIPPFSNKHQLTQKDHLSTYVHPTTCPTPPNSNWVRSVIYPTAARRPRAERVRDIKVRRFAQMPANRKNPGVHHTARQSRDGVPSGPGALADPVAGMRSLTVAARIGASRPSTFMSRAPGR